MANQRQVLSTVREVVDALGGSKAVSERADVTISAVSNWIGEGWIPPAWYLAMSAALREIGFDVDPRVFRQQQLRTENPEAADA
jgi:hypothetical protein